MACASLNTRGGSFHAMLGAYCLGHVRYAELSYVTPEFEGGALQTAAEVSRALALAHGDESAVTLPRLDTYLRARRQALGWGPRQILDDLQLRAQLAFDDGRNRVHTTMSSSKRCSSVPRPGTAHVPSLGVVNAQGLPRPGSSILLDGGAPNPFLLLHVGLIGGDGAVPAALKTVVMATAIYDAQMHVLPAIFSVGSGNADKWARVSARTTWNGGGRTATCRGVVRSFTYFLESSFYDPAAAREMARLLSSGSHTGTYGPPHVSATYSYMASPGLDLQECAATTLIGLLMADGTKRVGLGPGASYLDLFGGLSAGGNISATFTTANVHEALMTVELLRRLGFAAELPNPGPGKPFSVRISGRGQVGRFFECLEAALQRVVERALPDIRAVRAAVAAGQPLPVLGREIGRAHV